MNGDFADAPGLTARRRYVSLQHRTSHGNYPTSRASASVSRSPARSVPWESLLIRPIASKHGLWCMGRGLIRLSRS